MYEFSMIEDVSEKNGLWRPFEEARTFVQALQFKSRGEWRVYCKSGEKPADIPTNPNVVYSSAFSGMGDWLGTRTLSNRERTFLPFQEARAFVRELELKSSAEWRTYCASGCKPNTIPSNPNKAYVTEFQSIGDWLGIGTTASRNQTVSSFEEARAFVRHLELKNQEEWRNYCLSGKKPNYIPTNPQRTYRSQYQGMGDWLGTGVIAARLRRYLPFLEARAFVRGLGLKNEAAWRIYCKSGDKPATIPQDPRQTYGTEFQGLGDWLGTGVIASQNRSFLPFEEARAFARNLSLRNQQEWHAYCISGQRPLNIPANPLSAYGSDFQGYGDWLGTRTIAARNRTYRLFTKAREFVHQLGLKDKDAWATYTKSGNKPDDIPATPDRVYRADFQGYGDWLGTGTIAPHKHMFRPFEEARVFVHALKLRNQNEWRVYCASGEKPADIPVAPHVAYGPAFQGYGDWLGTGTIATHQLRYRSFTEARAFVRELGLEDQLTWHAYCTSGQKPLDIPRNPQRTYKAEFKGYGDWLGTINKWTKKALLALLHDLRPRLDQLEERELYIILQQGGALTALRVALNQRSPLRVLRDLQENEGKGIEQALGAISNDVFIEPMSDSLLEEEFLEEESTIPVLDLALDFEQESDRPPSNQAPLEETSPAAPEQGLPLLTSKESLRIIDMLAELSCGLDESAAEYLVANRVSALWERYTSHGRSSVDGVLADTGGYWFQEIKRRFLAELEGVENLTIPAGWSFTGLDGERAFPNAMQRRTAWTVREKRRVGNWSGVGAGKTLSAILASRVIESRLTLIITNNATTKGWGEQIQNAYPDSIVYLDIHSGIVPDETRYTYVVLNYEKFQGSGRNHFVQLLLDLHPDFIVFDEVQFVKQRDTQASNRRKALEALVGNASEANANLSVLGMSATPVINNLTEAKKLLEIITGLQFPELAVGATINNALAMHQTLMLHGFRYRPRYEQEIHTEVVAGTRNDLLEALQEVQNSVLRIEQILLPAKLEMARPYFCKGTIVYAYYVDEIVAPIRAYLENMGLSVGLYTGVDKSGFDPFCAGKRDILIGTSPVGTGLDGLQKVCNRLVILCLPWTGAEYEQIIGRIRRQGSHFGEVEIIIPQVMLDYQGESWSWDQGRMAVILYKRTLSDCAVDGYIPETVRINQHALLQQSREALERWIERIGQEGLLEMERPRLAVPLPSPMLQKIQARHGDFTLLNQRWSISKSIKTHERLQHDPSEWYLYHTLYRETREKWPEQPVERIAEHIRIRPDWIVGDFGCGECLLRQALPDNNVMSIDHIACDEQVIACDISSTPLDDACLDVVVFSLSLMGTNWTDYLKEAYRTLKPYGYLFIAEPQKKWKDCMEELKQAVEAEHFRLLGDMEQRYDFVYLTALKM